jgi:hypothetical protein
MKKKATKTKKGHLNSGSKPCMLLHMVNQTFEEIN